MIEVTSAAFVRGHAAPGGGPDRSMPSTTEAADGFILVPHVTPGGLDEFADTVVPILQEAGRFRSTTKGPTLRDHLGLGRLRRRSGTDHEAAVSMTALRVPLGILDLVPVVSGSTPAEPCGTPSTWSRWLSSSATAATGSPSTISTPASPARRPAADRHGGRRHRTDPAGFGWRPERPPHGSVGGGGVRPARRQISRPHRSGHRTLRGRDFFVGGWPTNRDPAGKGSTPRGSLYRKRTAHPRPAVASSSGKSPPYALTTEMLQQDEAVSADYGDCSTTSWRFCTALPLTRRPRPPPGAGNRSEVEPWILGSSAGESAEVAGRLGLSFAASYHISPATSLSASRRTARPSCRRPTSSAPTWRSRPMSSSPPTTKAPPVGSRIWPWVRSIRRGEGAIPFPGPDEASRHVWSDDEALVKDRTEAVRGSPRTVVEELERLAEATDADELIVTTITHDHQDRVRSFALLAHGLVRTAP